MADVRPFRALRYDPERTDLALTIAPPYDVISPDEQAELYRRSSYNAVRIEYGEQLTGDNTTNNRYTRAAADVEAWRHQGVLLRDDAPAIYAYDQQFSSGGCLYRRRAWFAAVRLEEWEKGVIKPHEHTLSGPKVDRLELLRATRLQISPVYCLFRARQGAPAMPPMDGDPLYDFESAGQRHTLSAVRDVGQLGRFAAHLAACDVFIADGHHRYETALAYRNEVRGRSSNWTGEEPENFMLMALTDVADPGLVVLPTHRVVTPPGFPLDALSQVARHFDVTPVAAQGGDRLASMLEQVVGPGGGRTAFAAAGFDRRVRHLLVLRDRAAVEAQMPAEQPAAWKRLDVNVLQFGILQPVFGIDAARLASGGAVAYVQDPIEAIASLESERARVAFLLNATPVDQVLAVADAGGRMPQKSTYFYPKLPTGLVMNPLD
jgi:uncharacterized protein (DUF1015 family)